MPWLRLDDAMLIHPKIIGLTDGAFALHVRGMLHSALYLTDGFVPKEIASRYGKTRALRELVYARLWHLDGAGYRIHDFLDYNRTRAEILEIRKKRAEAGREGGLTKAERGKASNLPFDDGNLPANDAAKSSAPGIPRIPVVPGTRQPKERRDAVPEAMPIETRAALDQIYEDVSRQPDPPSRRRRAR
jgi:hypothetical protein